jgi:hypothetical protein
MNALDFQISIDEINNGRLELADTIKISLWQYAPHWFDVLDFDNDSIFLEPLLFYYFRKVAMQENTVISLEQILHGYAPKGSMTSNIKVVTDSDGVIYLPNIGTFSTNTEGIHEKEITFSNNHTSIILDNQEIPLEPTRQINGGQFRLLNHKPYIYNELPAPVIFLEHINDSVSYSERKLVSVLKKMEENISSYFETIKLTTKEFAIFNSDTYESFAALHYFGTSFLNLAGQKQTEVFFLDDVAHQSGHTLYYTLTHNFQKFLKPDRDTPLKDFSNVSYEQRGIYGAFHGLFTYTTIMHCLHFALQNKWFENQEEEEALSRLGFYYGKFANDLRNMGDSRILTEEGWKYYDMFHSSFMKMKKEYHHIVKYFDYSNQNYNYSFQKFKEVNQFQTV